MTDDPTAEDTEGGVPWSAFLVEAEQRLAASGLEIGPAEARWIVEEASGADRVEEVLDTFATERGVVRFDRMLGRRLGGEPIQYVLGHWPFRRLDLLVDRRVLIPRPETETVAEHAVAAAADAVGRRELPVVVDLGTGSGAIGLSVAAEVRGVEVWLTDISEPALAVARANLAGLSRLGTNVRIEAGSWFEALPIDLEGAVSVVVSNPPYVDRDDPVETAVTEHEPHGALFADDGGRADLVHLVHHAPRWLDAEGVLVLEMAPTQTDAIAELATEHFVEVTVAEDLSGRPRTVVARRPRPERRTSRPSPGR